MNRTCAFFDILGFRTLIESEPADSLGGRFSKVAGDILSAENRPRSWPGQPTFFPELPMWGTWCISHIFSDSIILIAREDSEIGCLALLIHALRVLQTLIAFKMPARGGVAHGEIYVDEARSLYVGKALTRAFDLEQAQNWIGAAIDPSVPSAFPDMFSETASFGDVRRCLFPEYEVPLKSGPIRSLHTLNWRWNLVVVKGTRSLFDDTSDWSARTKVNAALLYALHMRQAGWAYPTASQTVPVEVAPHYVAAGPPPPSPPRHGDEF